MLPICFFACFFPIFALQPLSSLLKKSVLNGAVRLVWWYQPDGLQFAVLKNVIHGRPMDYGVRTLNYWPSRDAAWQS